MSRKLFFILAFCFKSAYQLNINNDLNNDKSDGFLPARQEERYNIFLDDELCMENTCAVGVKLRGTMSEYFMSAHFCLNECLDDEECDGFTFWENYCWPNAGVCQIFTEITGRNDSNVECNLVSFVKGGDPAPFKACNSLEGSIICHYLKSKISCWFLDPNVECLIDTILENINEKNCEKICKAIGPCKAFTAGVGEACSIFEYGYKKYQQFDEFMSMLEAIKIGASYEGLVLHGSAPENLQLEDSDLHSCHNACFESLECFAFNFNPEIGCQILTEVTDLDVDLYTIAGYKSDMEGILPTTTPAPPTIPAPPSTPAPPPTCQPISGCKPVDLVDQTCEKFPEFTQCMIKGQFAECSEEVPECEYSVHIAFNGVADFNSCIEICEVYPLCRAINYFESIAQCNIMKRGTKFISEEETYSSGAVLKLDEYGFRNGIHVTGPVNISKIISNTDIFSCNNECYENPECFAFSFNPQTGTCLILSDVTEITYDAISVSAYKENIAYIDFSTTSTTSTSTTTLTTTEPPTTSTTSSTTTSTTSTTSTTTTATTESTSVTSPIEECIVNNERYSLTFMASFPNLTLQECVDLAKDNYDEKGVKGVTYHSLLDNCILYEDPLQTEPYEYSCFVSMDVACLKGYSTSTTTTTTIPEECILQNERYSNTFKMSLPNLNLQECIQLATEHNITAINYNALMKSCIMYEEPLELTSNENIFIAIDTLCLLKYPKSNNF